MTLQIFYCINYAKNIVEISAIKGVFHVKLDMLFIITTNDHFQ